MSMVTLLSPLQLFITSLVTGAHNYHVSIPQGIVEHMGSMVISQAGLWEKHPFYPYCEVIKLSHAAIG